MDPAGPSDLMLDQFVLDMWSQSPNGHSGMPFNLPAENAAQHRQETTAPVAQWGSQQPSLPVSAPQFSMPEQQLSKKARCMHSPICCQALLGALLSFRWALAEVGAHDSTGTGTNGRRGPQ